MTYRESWGEKPAEDEADPAAELARLREERANLEKEVERLRDGNASLRRSAAATAGVLVFLVVALLSSSRLRGCLF